MGGTQPVSTKTGKPYAQGTPVLAEKSLAEIKSTLRRFGATGFEQRELWDHNALQLMFIIAGSTPDERRVRFTMRLPKAEEFKAIGSKGAKQRHQQEINRRWRALAAGIKAKLLLVEEKIETVEEAFYAHLVLPSGATVFEETHAAVAEAYRTDQMPSLLPGMPRPALPERRD